MACECSAEVMEKGGKEPLVREGARLTKGVIAKLKAAGVKEIPLTAGGIGRSRGADGIGRFQEEASWPKRISG